MRTLWSYGCSWTFSAEHERIGLKFWSTIVAEELNIPNIVNRGWGGESIGLAATKLMKDLQKIKKDDVVIFEFSYPERQRYYGYDHILSAHTPRTEVCLGNDKKFMALFDFILLFRSELIIREFQNVEPIFDYIENNIGAKVKYWFLNITPPQPTTGKEISPELIEETVWNENRTVLFPPKEKRRKSFSSVFSRYLEADAMIIHDQLRYCDNGGGLKIFTPISNDTHPDQRGQNEIAKCILNSFNEPPPKPPVNRLI